MGRMLRTVTFEVEVLSPVHVGTGRVLGKHDLAVIGGRLWRFDPDRVLEGLSRSPVMMEHYLSDGAQVLAGWPESKRASCARYVVEWSGLPPGDVREHVADATGRPYLPGSSVKGAVRSAILWSCHRHAHEKVKEQQRALIGKGGSDPERAGGPLERGYFGKDPNRNVMRVLMMEDSDPLPAGLLRVAELRIAVEDREGRLAWFAGPHRRADDPRKGVAVWAECLPPGARTRMKVTLDRFLLWNVTEAGAEAPSRPAEELGFERRRKLLETWTRSCNSASMARAEAEQRWASSLGLEAVAGFYRRLLAEMGRAGDGVYLWLGWGTGWRGKTVVEPLGEEAVERARAEYRLGRDGSPFPKTRRVVFVNGAPSFPMGWVRLRPVRQEEDL